MADAAVAVFAKAPVPGYAKTRLIPLLGEEGAAAFQARLIEHTLGTACSAGIGPVTLWCSPDEHHAIFQAAAGRGIALRTQRSGDLGERMLAAFAAQPPGQPLVLIGTDCPCLTADDLTGAVATLDAGADAVISPAEDGGYGLIAAARPLPDLFGDISWSTASVAQQTRARAQEVGLRLAELRPVWDIDTPGDYLRLLADTVVGPRLAARTPA